MQTRLIQSLTKLPTALAKALTPLLNGQFTGHITAAQVEQLKADSHLSDQALMAALLPVAAAFAAPPISEFYVGGIIRGGSGDLYLGFNVEFSGEALNQSVHGEQCGISYAWLMGETSITDVVVNASPCGHCRQFINELVNGQQVSIQLPNLRAEPLSHYLPEAFGPQDLGDIKPLLSHQGCELVLESDDPIVLEALDHASKSYAPYSHCYAAVVIELQDGRRFAGRYAENAAFNPSMLPMQMAYCQLLRHGVHAEEIERVVLVESNQGKVSLFNTTLTTLQAISQVPLEHLFAEPLPQP